MTKIELQKALRRWFDVTIEGEKWYLTPTVYVQFYGMSDDVDIDGKTVVYATTMKSMKPNNLVFYITSCDCDVNINNVWFVDGVDEAVADLVDNEEYSIVDRRKDAIYLSKDDTCVEVSAKDVVVTYRREKRRYSLAQFAYVGAFACLQVAINEIDADKQGADHD